MKALQKVLLIVLATLGIAMFVVNLALIRKNRELRGQLDAKFDSLEAKPGTLLSPIEGTDAAGKKVTVNWDSKKYSLVMIFTTICGYCEQNWPNWVSLIEKTNRERVNVILVDLSGEATNGFLHARGVNGTPLVHVDPAFIITYHVRFVPDSILVGPDGRVVKTWFGVLKQGEEDDILRKCQNEALPNVAVE